MNECRKRVLLIAASFLAAWKLVQFDGGKKALATVAAVGDAVAGRMIMKAITNGGRMSAYLCGVSGMLPVAALYCSTHHATRREVR